MALKSISVPGDSPLTVFIPDGFRYEPRHPSQKASKPFLGKPTLSLIENNPYTSIFFSREHDNFITIVDEEDPVFASVLQEEAQITQNGINTAVLVYRILLWKSTGCQLKSVRADSIRSSKWKCTGEITVNRILQTFDPQLAVVEWDRVEDTSLNKILREREKRANAQTFKFGMLYSAQGQTHEREMFGNQVGSPEYNNFLSMIGETINLKGWREYAGRLDTSENFSGTQSVYTKWKNGLQIMWHVSTLLPHKFGDEQRIEKKRHIGNDLCVMVFVDGDTPFRPNTIKSKQIHLIGVVRQVWPVSINTAPRPEGWIPTLPTWLEPFDPSKIYYQVQFVTRSDVKNYPPKIPENAIFERGTFFRDLLITKFVNGERRTYHSPAFKRKMKFARQMSLKRIAEQFLFEIEEEDGEEDIGGEEQQ